MTEAQKAQMARELCGAQGFWAQSQTIFEEIFFV